MVELRIGNYIMDDEGLLSKVVGFAPYDHSVRCDEKEGCQIKIDFWDAKGELNKGWAVDSPECNPIPISPEWLGRCGFEKKSNEMQIDGIEMTYHIDDSTYFSSCGGLKIWPKSHRQNTYITSNFISREA